MIIFILIIIIFYYLGLMYFYTLQFKLINLVAKTTFLINSFKFLLYFISFKIEFNYQKNN